MIADDRYIIHIAAPAHRVWEALTDGKISPLYFFGRRVDSDWKTGSPWRMWMPDPLGGKQEVVDSQGIVTHCQEGQSLAMTWRVMWVPAMRDFPEGHVTYTLKEAASGLTRLQMDQAHESVVDPKFIDLGREGWAAILSGLKTLLETGKPMPMPDMGP